MSIDPADPRPVFRQIVDEVQRCVAIGVLKPSDALPAARALAAQLKVNANTVQHAYRTLEQEGTVNVRRGAQDAGSSGPATGRRQADRGEDAAGSLPPRTAGERPDERASGNRPETRRRGSLRCARS